MGLRSDGLTWAVEVRGLTVVDGLTWAVEVRGLAVGWVDGRALDGGAHGLGQVAGVVELAVVDLVT